MENKLILHRGYKGKYPENSEMSFYYAVKKNLPFETDIRVSKDGKCFMIHDDNLDRLFNGNGRIEDFNSGELGKFSYKESPYQKLCSLEELCILIKKMNYNNLIFIHIKELKDLSNVVEILEEYDLSNLVRFFAVDELTFDLIKMVKRTYPKYKVGLHFNDNSKINEEEFKIANFIWADEINKKNITPELITAAHRFGKPIYVISPELISESILNADIETRWKEFIEMNVDGICTDKPIEFSKFLEDY